VEAGLGLSALSAVYLPRGSAPQYGRWQSFGATAKQFIVSTGGGETGEAAGFCVGGGGGKGLEAALGAGSALAVCVLETDLWPPTWWTGFDTGWSTMWTGLGARVGGGFSQNEWSGCGPRVTWTVCGT